MSSTNSTKTYNLWSTKGDEFIAAVIVLGKYVFTLRWYFNFSPELCIEVNSYEVLVIAFPEIK